MKTIADWIPSLSENSFLEALRKADESHRRHLLRLRMREDPEFFARHLLSEYCRLPFSPLHGKLFAWHRRMGEKRLAERRGLRHALAAPRGSAKSTIVSLVLPLHDLLFHRERYIVLLSATERQAVQRLRGIGRELGRFPVSPGRLTNRFLEYGECRVEAHGSGTELRGISHNGWRPTKVILDDAEGSRCATSARARSRLIEWFAEIVEYLGDTYTHILAAGTILHEQSLLATLTGREDFTGHRARSVLRHAPPGDHWNVWKSLLRDVNDENRRETARRYFLRHRKEMERGSRVLWPEKEDYEELMAQLTLQGRRAFMQEKQNTPLGPEDALFDTAAALRAEEHDRELVLLSHGRVLRRHGVGWAEGRRFGYLDSALGKKSPSRAGDFAAVATVLVLPDGTFLLEHLLARRCGPSGQIKLLFDFHARRPWELLAIEGTGFQELLMLPFEEERKRRHRAGKRADLPVKLVHPKKQKQVRIAALEPLLQSGLLILSANLDEEFWEELAAWPRGDHDDALDAAAGAVQLARESTGKAAMPPGRPARRGGRRTAPGF